MKQNLFSSKIFKILYTFRADAKCDVLLRHSIIYSVTQHLLNDITANCDFKQNLLGSGGIYYRCPEKGPVIYNKSQAIIWTCKK